MGHPFSMATPRRTELCSLPCFVVVVVVCSVLFCFNKIEAQDPERESGSCPELAQLPCIRPHPLHTSSSHARPSRTHVPGPLRAEDYRQSGPWCHSFAHHPSALHANAAAHTRQSSTPLEGTEAKLDKRQCLQVQKGDWGAAQVSRGGHGKSRGRNGLSLYLGTIVQARLR